MTTTAPLWETNAFRSPFHDMAGFRMLEWRDGFVRIRCELKQHHQNRQGAVHGGVVLALIDEAGGAAGVYSADPAVNRKSVSVTLDAKFVGRAQGDWVEVTGRVAGQGRSLYFVQSEVRDSHGALVAFGTSTHRWRRGSGPDHHPAAGS
jgi:uncharacterized protein (TIGR00369 family)